MGGENTNVPDVIYLKMLMACSKVGVADDSYDVVLVSLDIKDAFGYCTGSICFSRIYIFDLVAHFGSRTYVWRN